MSSPIWKHNDILIAKGSKAKVLDANRLNGQNWVRVQYDGQEYEGYQTEFEGKGWHKSNSANAVVGCGCLTFIGVFLLTAIVSSFSNSPQPDTASTYQQPTSNSNQTSRSLPVPAPIPTPVLSPSPSPIKRAITPPSITPTPKVVEQLPKQSPTKTLAKPPTNSPPKLKPIRISKAGKCECPYDTDKAGKSCGARAAYIRKNGRSGDQCYTND
ncbi:MAG: hypothetical protein ABI417_10810 [Coleofasciculaceae cyanobacterium]